MARRRLEGLTGLRFVAALHVVWFHYGWTVKGLPEWLAAIERKGQTSVCLFFVLSGFLLTYQYRDRLREGRTTARAFLFARFARLYPLYALACLFGSVTCAYGDSVTPRLVASTFGQLLGIGAWSHYLNDAGNPPAWSLSAEMFFYLAFPFVVERLFARASDWMLCTRVLLIWLVSVTMLRVGLDAHPGPGLQEFLFQSPLTRAPDFLVGVGVGHLYLRDLDAKRTRRGDLVALPSLVALLLALASPIEARNGSFALLFAALIYGIAHGGLLASVLSTRPLVALGDASFALYILQAPVYLAVHVFGGVAWERRPHHFLEVVLVLVPIALLAHHDLELPLQRWLLARYARPRAVAGSALVT